MSILDLLDREVVMGSLLFVAIAGNSSEGACCVLAEPVEAPGSAATVQVAFRNSRKSRRVIVIPQSPSRSHLLDSDARASRICFRKATAILAGMVPNNELT